MDLGDIDNKGENNEGADAQHFFEKEIALMREGAEAAKILAEITFFNGYICRCLSEDLKAVLERYKQQID